MRVWRRRKLKFFIHVLFLIFIQYFSHRRGFIESKYINANIFQVTSQDDPVPPGYQANLGNGHLAYDVGCPCGDSNDTTSSAGYVFVAGLYSGEASTGPSHKVLIPNHLSVFVEEGYYNDQKLDVSRWTATLNIENGVFTNTTTFEYHSDPNKYFQNDRIITCSIQMVWFVHRRIRYLSVLKINSSSSSTDGLCTFKLKSCEGSPQYKDLSILSGFDMDEAIVTVYKTKNPEISKMDTLQNDVLSITDKVPDFYPFTYNYSRGKLEFSNSSTQSSIFLNWIDSTSWTDSPLSKMIEHLPKINSSEKKIINFVSKYFNQQMLGTNSDISKKSSLIPLNDYYELYSSHKQGWAYLWRQGIEIEGNETIAASTNTSLYYILSAVDESSSWSISPGGLTKNSYNGHVFWDCETWILPALLPFYPNLVLNSFVNYRLERQKAALARAYEKGYKGAMLPWESAVTGLDVTPPNNLEGEYEIHVTADVPLSFRLVHYWTGNDTWLLENSTWSYIYECCEFLSSRVSCLERNTKEKKCVKYSYQNVQPPDEKAGIVNGSVFTNAASQILLNWAYSIEEKKRKGEMGSKLIKRWREIADHMSIPVVTKVINEDNQLGSKANSHLVEIHPEYNNYEGQPINQADVVLLQFPLMFEMLAKIAYNDLQYYSSRTSIPGESRAFYTGDSSYSIAFLNLFRQGFTPNDCKNVRVSEPHKNGNQKDEGRESQKSVRFQGYHSNEILERYSDKKLPNSCKSRLLELADDQFLFAFDHIDTDNFFIWKETTDGGHLNFLTGAGGYLQNILYGYVGIILNEDELVMQPILPSMLTKIKLRSLKYRGISFNVSFDENNIYISILPKSTLELKFDDSIAACSLKSTDSKGIEHIELESANCSSETSNIKVAMGRKIHLSVFSTK